jgi:hypothetical protein
MAVLILVALFPDTISAASFRYPFAASARGRKSPQFTNFNPARGAEPPLPAARAQRVALDLIRVALRCHRRGAAPC